MLTQTRKLQLIQLLILKDVADYCDKNDITYYLVGGTLLGAVRHNGFIPWDDDVDIAMYRDDYDRFIKGFSKAMNEKYFVQNNHTDKNYSRFVTKVRLNGTKQIERNIADVDMHHGIYIDIFPLDKISSIDSLALRFRGIVINFLSRFSTIRAGKRSHESMWKDSIKRSLRIFTFLVPRNFVNRLFDFVCTLTNDSNCKYTTSFVSGFGWKKQTFFDDVYLEGKKIKFEDCKFNVPEKPEVILERLYGDYMKLPPINKRVSGHTLIEVDFGTYASFFERETQSETTN